MKKLILPIALGATLAASASAQTTAYEGFEVTGLVGSDYTDGGAVIGTNGGSNYQGAWLDGGGNGGASLDAQATGLSYLNLTTTSGSLIQSVGGFDKLRRQVANGDQSGTVYFSYLYNAASSGNNLDYFSFGEALGQERFRIIRNSGEFDVQYNGSVIGSTTTLSSLSSFFVVGEYTSGTTGDGLNLWFNPTDLSDVAGTAIASLSFDEGTDFSFAYGFEYNQISFNIVNTEYDEIRWSYGTGASIADVTPVPEPSSYALISGFLALGWIMVRRRP